jgi:hypothetical protein
MAQDNSFDIVSEVDLQVVDDCVNVARKEIDNRFDLKGHGITLDFSRGEKRITLTAPAEFSAKQALDILHQKLSKREVSRKALKLLKSEKAHGGAVRETYEIIVGIDMDLCRQMVKDIKALGLKVQSAIQENKIRVNGRSKDDLQKVIHAVREKDYPLPLQFVNYR